MDAVSVAELELFRQEVREREVGFTGEHGYMGIITVVLVLLGLFANGSEEMLMESSEELSVLSGGFQVKSYNFAILHEQCRVVKGEGIELPLLVVIGYGFLYIFDEIFFIPFSNLSQTDGYM